MAEDDTPKRVDDDKETPQIAVPSHNPLPPPPEIHYTRPTSGKSVPPPPHSLGAHSKRTAQEDDASAGSSAVKLGSGLAAATTFAASIIAGFLIGQWIDHRWNHGGGLPWGTLVFSLAGVAAGFLNLFRVLSATDRSRHKK